MTRKTLSALSLALFLAGAGQAPVTATYESHTEPSERSEVSFSSGGVVLEVLVKDGDMVKKGQALARLDDRADRHAWEALKLEGDSDLKIKAAKADLAQKQVELDRKEKLAKDPTSPISKTELDEARVAVLIREIQVQIEEMTKKQKKLDADRQGVKVEQMTISAPFDGVIEKVDIHPGETPDPNRHSSIFVVKNDVLWVNAYLPTGVTLKLKVGDTLDVRYKDTSEVVKGKVVFLSPVADAASEQRRVKLEIANSALIPSGQTVNVVLPLSLGGAAADSK